ncbi:DUF47 domain-containing protein [Acidaminobacterium chupaoyuni]
MPRTKGFNYFESFQRMAEVSCQMAETLDSILRHYDPDVLPRKMEEMHELEHAGDKEQHDMLNHLLKEFITPIEREDIMALGAGIDDVNDAIEDILMRAYMYDIRKIPPCVLEFSDILAQCCALMKKMLIDFENFRKSTTIKQRIIEINEKEEEGDRLYVESIHTLYAAQQDMKTIRAEEQLIEFFEKSCDACEEAANIVESIILKNS